MISQYKQKQLQDEYLYNKCSKDEFDDWYVYSSDTPTDELKYIIHTYLTDIEKTIILLYIKMGYVDLSKTLGVSVGTAFKKVKQIKEKIKQYVNT